jgi:myosin heavy chain 9/10/11/14
LQRQLTVSNAKHQEYEDTVLQIEREKATWTRQLESLKAQLESETARRTNVEKNATGRFAEATRLREKMAKMEKDMVNLQKDIGDRDWQIKQLKANQNKTIVEHVHVLQEAKRVTDGQLEEALRELAAEQARTKALEKTKVRLMGEAEDMTRQHEQELIALRSNEKNARSLEQKATKAVADMEREKGLREVTESQSRRFQAELIEAQTQLSDLERQLQSTQRAKESLESEISSLAADGDTTRALKKLRRDYEAKISQLEIQVEEADTARTTMEKIRQKIEQQHAEIRRLITTSGARDSFRERLLKELQTLDDSLIAEFAKKPSRSSKRNSVQSLANLTHAKRSSISIETNGLGRSRKDSQPPDSPYTPHIPQPADRNTTQLKQQVQALELRIVASDRVRQHLEATLKEMTADLERSDGSKDSINAHRSKIARENARLADLLSQEAEARRAAEAAHMEGISSMWKKFQGTIDSERESYIRLEESRKALVSRKYSYEYV